MATMFSHHSWITCWWRHFGPGNFLAIILIRRGEELIGAAPLYVCAWEGFRHLGVVGSSTVDYEDLIIRDGEDCEAVFQVMFNAMLEYIDWDVCRLNKIPADSVTRRLISSSKDAVCLSGRTSVFSTASSIRMSGTWEQYWQSLPGGLRRDTERQRRRLSADGRQVVSRCAETSADIDRLFAALTAQHVRRRRFEKEGYSIFEDPATSRFYRELALRMHSEGALDLAALEVDGVVAAVHLGFHDRHRYYYLVPTFDSAYSSYSIGRLLMLDLMKRWWGQVDVFDLSLGDEAYKLSFATDVRDLVSVSFFRRSMRGRLARVWFDELRRRIRSMPVAQQILPWLRRVGLQRRAA